MRDSVDRFSRVAEVYDRYRPRYPKTMVPLLEEKCGLAPTQVVADVGSGTGLLSRNFLANGNQVFCVEPNDEMRHAAESLLSGRPGFKSIKGTAENSRLQPSSIDLVTAGQAFHWFEHDRAREEFLRILKPDGWVVLVWNLGRNNGSPFDLDMAGFVKEYIDPRIPLTGKRRRPAYIDKFFIPGHFKETGLENAQVCDFDRLRGRILSASRAPGKEDPRHEAMLSDLARLFDRHQVNGTVTLGYDTQVVYGQIKETDGYARAN